MTIYLLRALRVRGEIYERDRRNPPFQVMPVATKPSHSDKVRRRREIRENERVDSSAGTEGQSNRKKHTGQFSSDT